MAAAIRAVKVNLQTNLCHCRSISTSSSCYGKRNFRKFLLYEKRGSKLFKQMQQENPDPNIPVETRGMRGYEVKIGKKSVTVPEMIPELVVPNLDNFKLKPYVSYQAPDVVQSKFTAKDLFDAVYARKIMEDFQKEKLDKDGNSLEPSEYEALTSEEAKIRARKTGSDIF